MRAFPRRLIPVLVLLLPGSGASAQQAVPATAPPTAPAAAPAAEVKETTSVTKHTIDIGGQRIPYTATAGTIVLRDDKNKPEASVFYVAYTRDDVTDRARRPIFYSFNGGPGTASVWMHMGFTGPRKVVYDDEGMMPAPPFRLATNEHAILDIADIVYIDPVGTGFSRMAPGEDPHKFHGVMPDIRSVGEFIRLYTTRHSRWDSPKFLIGESYGTTRAAGLVNHMQEAHQMYFNGVIQVSMTGLDYQLGTDLRFALSLPHYTATAWYHKALPPDLQARPLPAVLQESEQFALGPYLDALVKGDALTGSERDTVAAQIGRLAGLSSQYVINSHLRIERARFRKELLRSRGVTVGRLDSRYTGIDRDAAGATNEYDPAMEAWNGPFAAVINDYFRAELKWETDTKYNIWGDVRPWRRDPPTNTGEMLRAAMTQNPFLRVLVLAAYFDGATDYFSAQYVMSHLDPGGSIKDRVSFAFYESGHMMYVRKSDLAKSKRDLAEFVRQSLGSGTPRPTTAQE
ncbi:MAG: S10 family peptidase [Vicinamibacterales bacterium]